MQKKRSEKPQPAIPGAAGFIRSLSSGKIPRNLFIASGMDRECVELDLDHHGIKELFGRRIFASPHSKAMTLTSVHASVCFGECVVMFGDTADDMSVAKANRAIAIGRVADKQSALENKLRADYYIIDYTQHQEGK